MNIIKYNDKRKFYQYSWKERGVKYTKSFRFKKCRTKEEALVECQSVKRQAEYYYHFFNEKYDTEEKRDIETYKEQLEKSEYNGMSYFSNRFSTELMSYMYILQKHKSTGLLYCLGGNPYQYGDQCIEEHFKKYMEFGIYCQGNIINHLDSITTIPAKSEKDLFINIEKLGEKNKYVFIPITLNIQGGGAHANMLMINPKEKYAERFEPHIQTGMKSVDAKKLSKSFRDLFERNGYKFRSSIEIHNKLDYQTGFQSRESRASCNKKNKKKCGVKIVRAGGYCTGWSLYYMDMVLTYPNTSTDILLGELSKLSNDKISINFHKFLSFQQKMIKNYMKFKFRDDKTGKINNKFLKQFMEILGNSRKTEKLKLKGVEYVYTYKSDIINQLDNYVIKDLVSYLYPN